MSSIFLSASVPNNNSFFQCDPMLIQTALRTFLFTVLGRKHLVFGGHPTISPLILAICEDVGVENKSAVTIYQSKYFEELAPKDNAKFENLISVQAAESRAASLIQMRGIMMRRHQYEAAVFIGGHEGILEEHEMFKRYHPHAKIIALQSPGGAAATITPCEQEYDDLLDYVGLFTTSLQIQLNSERNLTFAPQKNNPKNGQKNFNMGYKL